jgi:hypothetical protein
MGLRAVSSSLGGEDAFAAYDTAFAIDPALDYLGRLPRPSETYLCDWDHLADDLIALFIVT